jgi:hypothetical protein
MYSIVTIDRTLMDLSCIISWSSSLCEVTSLSVMFGIVTWLLMEFLYAHVSVLSMSDLKLLYINGEKRVNISPCSCSSQNLLHGNEV